MDHDYTLDELLGMLRRVMVYVDCDINSGTEKWCGKYKTCIGCRTALIDAIERKVAEEVTKAHNDGYDEGYASADDWCAEHEDAMAEHGWYRALDADGEVTRIGDKMEWSNGTFTVHELKVTEDGWTTWDEVHGYTVHLDECRHHPPTVEDMLWEFVGALDVVDRIALDETVTDFAKRLRLADKED